MTADYEAIDKCRVCHGADLVPLFSLGEHYVSDFVPADEAYSGIRAPLDLVLCQGCTLVQLRHTVNQERLYRKYWYTSGTTQTMRDALRDVTREAERRANIGPDDIVLDIGSSDGTLLRSYSKPCFKVGFEPAKNLRVVGREGVDFFVNDFWSADLFTTVPAKVVTCIGMIYDLPQPHDFIRDVARVLHPDGVFIAQLMMLKDMLAMGDVGNVCHEHLEFYSQRSFFRLLATHGLEVVDLETNTVNGQSTRFYIRHAGGKEYKTFATWWAEKELNYDRDPSVLRAWFAAQQKAGEKVHNYVRAERLKGKRIWVLAASTKGNTLLQFWSLDNRLIDGASERSPEKVGLVTAGTGIPIVSEEDARAAKPDLMLVLPYAFADEIIARERPWLDTGGVFVVPLPVPRLVYVEGGELKERML